MIELVEKDHELWAAYFDHLSRPTRVDLSAFLCLTDWPLLLHPIINFIGRVGTRSYVNYLRATSKMGKVLCTTGIKQLPTLESDWQDLVIEIQHQIIRDPSSDASLKTRIHDTLQTINNFLSHLQEEGVIPFGVEIPDYRKSFEKVDYTVHLSELLGDKALQPSDSFPTKLLCGISLKRSDAAYLDEIHVELVRRRECLRTALQHYFTAMKEHFEFGKQAMEQVDPECVLERIKHHGSRYDDKGKYHRSGKHYCAPSDPEGLKRFLAVSYYLYRGLPPDAGRVLPRMESWKLPKAGVLGFADPFPGVSDRRFQREIMAKRLLWMMGVISHADVAVLSALLIMDHPRFTPESVTGARLFDKAGKLNLVLGDGSETFEVIKERAKAVKREHLTELGREIIHFLIEYTEPQRRMLSSQQNSLSDLLFICKPPNRRREFSPPRHEYCVGFLSGQPEVFKRFWIGSYYPELREAGLCRGTISFKKIRNTEGVLEWFKSGSISAVSRKLGNTTRTVIGHYIPPALLAAWNTRLIRRFQNLWIAIAAVNEPFMLEVTDFSSLEDLHEFIEQMLSAHDAGSSPLADRLHRLFGACHLEMHEVAGTASLSVSISKPTLTALYCYSDAVLDAGAPASLLNAPDPIHAIRPQQFLDLALLLRRTLPNHEQSEVRCAHVAAEESAQALRGRLNWTRLILDKENAQT